MTTLADSCAVVSIQPAPNAPDGSVSTLSAYAPADFPPTAAVLCRNAAPLLAFAMALLRRRVPCHILGRDIEKGLLRTIDSVGKNVSSVSEFVGRLEWYRQREGARARTRAARGAVDDRCDAITAVAQACVSVDDIKATVSRLFANGTGVTLATVHKAKGLEWETVFLLDRHLIPSRYAEADWELRQEKNIMYVAVTRAKLHLKYITSDSWK